MSHIRVATNIDPILFHTEPADGITIKDESGVMMESVGATPEWFEFTLAWVGGVTSGFVANALYDRIKKKAGSKSVYLRIEEQKIDFHSGQAQRRIVEVIEKKS